MAQQVKTPPTMLHIRTQVVGAEGGVLIAIDTRTIPESLSGLAEIKQITRQDGYDWAETATAAMAGISALFGDLAAVATEGSKASLDAEQHRLMEMHADFAVWLLHRLHKLGEAVGKANREMTVLTIFPGVGLRGVSVGFVPISASLRRAVNDNTPYFGRDE